MNQIYDRIKINCKTVLVGNKYNRHDLIEENISSEKRYFA